MASVRNDSEPENPLFSTVLSPLVETGRIELPTSCLPWMVSDDSAMT